ALHSDGKDVQVIFVTLDPKRDTAEVLRDYVAAFDPTFIGLRGSETAIAKVAKDFRIIFDKEDGKENTREYTVYHMTGTYVFDKAGRARLFAPTDSPDLLVKDLQALLSGG
ncbi:MAG TPA: SCO family protein, partial [Burkholderiales bacterium]|nr:SCO family protein [Burkholderiales bacterium]